MGPAQMHNKQMGLNPIKKIERFAQNIRNLAQFQKIPKF